MTRMLCPAERRQRRRLVDLVERCEVRRRAVGDLQTGHPPAYRQEHIAPAVQPLRPSLAENEPARRRVLHPPSDARGILVSKRPGQDVPAHVLSSDHRQNAALPAAAGDVEQRLHRSRVELLHLVDGQHQRRPFTDRAPIHHFGHVHHQVTRSQRVAGDAPLQGGQPREGRPRVGVGVRKRQPASASPRQPRDDRAHRRRLARAGLTANQNMRRLPEVEPRPSAAFVLAQPDGQPSGRHGGQPHGYGREAWQLDTKPGAGQLDARRRHVQRGPDLRPERRRDTCVPGHDGQPKRHRVGRKGRAAWHSRDAQFLELPGQDHRRQRCPTVGDVRPLGRRPGTSGTIAGPASRAQVRQLVKAPRVQCRHVVNVESAGRVELRAADVASASAGREDVTEIDVLPGHACGRASPA